VAPVESIDAKKAERVRRAVGGWLAAHPEARRGGLRLDAASVTFDGVNGAPRVTYYEDAFRQSR
jgi:Holliday junction resolvase-like predicted endonuclease